MLRRHVRCRAASPLRSRGSGFRSAAACRSAAGRGRAAARSAWPDGSGVLAAAARRLDRTAELSPVRCSGSDDAVGFRTGWIGDEVGRHDELRRDHRDIVEWVRLRGGGGPFGLNRVPPQKAPPQSQASPGGLEQRTGDRKLEADLRSSRAARAAAGGAATGAVRRDDADNCLPSGNWSAPFAPTKPPTILFAPDDTLPLDVDGSIKPKFTPTSPPARLFAPLPVTDELEVESMIEPRLKPTSPPR